MLASEIARRLTNVLPQSDKTAALMDEVTARLIDLGTWIVENTPECREQSLAITAVEEVSFWVKKTIALNQ
jgi:hypothetical protein